jgi:signal transduction histidine kinase
MLSFRDCERVRRAASHDLRSGLTNLAVALDDLRRSIPEASDLHRHLDRAGASVNQIVALADDLAPSVPGPGVPEDDSRRIFHRFWTGDRDGNGGTGLGLSIARRHVEALGGRIRAGNREDGGAAITFTLPRAPGRAR